MAAAASEKKNGSLGVPRKGPRHRKKDSQTMDLHEIHERATYGYTPGGEDGAGADDGKEIISKNGKNNSLSRSGGNGRFRSSISSSSRAHSLRRRHMRRKSSFDDSFLPDMSLLKRKINSVDKSLSRSTGRGGKRGAGKGSKDGDGDRRSAEQRAREAKEEEEAEKRRRLRRPRFNSTSTLFVNSSMAAPDRERALRGIAAIVEHHLVSPWTEKLGGPFDEFGDDESMDDPKHWSKRPTVKEIFEVARTVFEEAQLEVDCLIICLVYVERLLHRNPDDVKLTARNFRPLILTSMMLASKVWDDMSMWNGDFAGIFGEDFTISELNGWERSFLDLMSYNMHVKASLYARFYFRLRCQTDLLPAKGAKSPAPVDRKRAAGLKLYSRRGSMEAKQRRRAATLEMGVAAALTKRFTVEEAQAK